MIEIDCTRHGIAGIPQHGMTHLAIQFVDLLKKMNDEFLIRLQHVNSTPCPGACARTETTPSSNANPLAGSGKRLRCESRSI